MSEPERAILPKNLNESAIGSRIPQRLIRAGHAGLGILARIYYLEVKSKLEPTLCVLAHLIVWVETDAITPGRHRAYSRTMNVLLHFG